ncbi:MAG: hypothetical protein J5685_09410 [Clostridiales bacterium]|nr:hypothetical protein [Clostridiales bacterium]
MEHRLIILEGLPGTGKSTDSHLLYRQLIRSGKKVRWIHEVSQPHPAVFFTESCFSKDEYRCFVKEHPDVADILETAAEVRRTTVGIDQETVLRKCRERGDEDPEGSEWYRELLKYDAFPSSLDRYEAQALEKWDAFAKIAAQDEDTVFILDSSIFQYQIFTYLLKAEPYERVCALVKKVMECLKPLDPFLIYLYRKDTDDSIAFLKNQRGIGDLEHMWERDKNEPYYCSKQNDVTAFFDFLIDYADYASRLFDELDCGKIKIDISGNDWRSYEDRILGCFDIGRMEAPSYKAADGTYVNAGHDISFTIADGRMTDPEGVCRSLSPLSANEFFVEGLPTILEFFDDRHIRLHGQQIIPQWTETGMIYEKS